MSPARRELGPRAAWRRLVVQGLVIGGLLGSRSALGAEPRPTPALVDYDAAKPQRHFGDYARAAANVTFANWAIWQLAWVSDKDWVPVTRQTLRANLEAGFKFDEDELQTNFFGHPYHGALQFNSARSAGLTFWESTLYTFAGSLTWELFAERETPALNDLAVTTLGGIMLGEITHRLSSRLLDESESGGPRLLSELLGASVNPMRGFTRATTGRSWRSGPRPQRRPLRLELELGVDQVRLTEDEDVASARPALLFAADAFYGNLLPETGRSFQPFEFFELYAAANLLNQQLSGAHVYASGLLAGGSLRLSSDERLHDNDVLGLAMNYEYVGTNFTTYSSVGLGPVNHLVLRIGRRPRLLLSAGADFVPILGVYSTEAGDTGRDYNIAVAVSPWSGLKLSLGRGGELGLRMRHYVGRVVNGEPGVETIGSMRLWYELPLIGNLGLGVAPTLVYRSGQYRQRASYSAHQISAQLYATSSL